MHFSGTLQDRVNPLSSAVVPKSSHAFRTRFARSIVPREGFSTPASVFEIMSIVLMISRRRSHSSIAPAAIASYSAGDFPVVRVTSAIPRIRVSGLFRSWAMSSPICRISVTRVSMRSSMELKVIAS